MNVRESDDAPLNQTRPRRTFPGSHPLKGLPCSALQRRVGTVAVARAAADGHTLVACTVGTCGIIPTLVKNSGYDVAKDFVPVILIGGVANIFVVTPTFPPKSIKELVALAKARPGEIVFGSGGVGNSPHMTVELLKYRAKIDMTNGGRSR